MPKEEPVLFKFNQLPDLVTPADLIKNNFPGGKSRVYQLFNTDGFPCFRMGKRFVVTKDSLKNWVDLQYNGNYR